MAGTTVQLGALIQAATEAANAAAEATKALKAEQSLRSSSRRHPKLFVFLNRLVVRTMRMTWQDEVNFLFPFRFFLSGDLVA